MSTTHVFIVDSVTFPIHLDYMFSGTGAKDEYIDFNGNNVTTLHYQKENNLLGMISDSQRVRTGDFILFYLQQNSSQGIYEGRFFGIFRACSEFSFLDNNDENQYLRNELNKSLTFRTLIEPFEVYRFGVTEWEALDEIKNLNSPNQMLWSLIYRKLKGNRGNTMITIYESERLIKLIRDKNDRASIDSQGFSFDNNSQEIIKSIRKEYTGRKESINILPRLIRKYQENMAFETHLQAYILRNLGRGSNLSLDICVLGNSSFEWLGNEVSCGVGMQRIDIAVSLTSETRRTLKAIELKAVEANPIITNQLQRYVDWLEQYYLPNRISDIQPVVIAKKIGNKKHLDFDDLRRQFDRFNNKNKSCYPIEYVEYQVIDNDLHFEKIEY